MARYAGLFRIRPELGHQYENAHRDIWPDMERAMRESGIRNHSLFLGGDGRVIIYAEADNLPESMARLAATEVASRWQVHMRTFWVEVDETTGTATTELFREIYHMKENS